MHYVDSIPEISGMPDISGTLSASFKNVVQIGKNFAKILAE